MSAGRYLSSIMTFDHCESTTRYRSRRVLLAENQQRHRTVCRCARIRGSRPTHVGIISTSVYRDRPSVSLTKGEFVETEFVDENHVRGASVPMNQRASNPIPLVHGKLDNYREGRGAITSPVRNPQSVDVVVVRGYCPVNYCPGGLCPESVMTSIAG